MTRFEPNGEKAKSKDRHRFRNETRDGLKGKYILEAGTKGDLAQNRFWGACSWKVLQPTISKRNMRIASLAVVLVLVGVQAAIIPAGGSSDASEEIRTFARSESDSANPDSPAQAQDQDGPESNGGANVEPRRKLGHSVAPIGPQENPIVYILQATTLVKVHRDFQANTSAPASSSTSEVRLWNSSAAITVFPSSTAKGNTSASATGGLLGGLTSGLNISGVVSGVTSGLANVTNPPSLSLPSLTMPSLSFPSLTMPSLSFPSITMPSLSLTSSVRWPNSTVATTAANATTRN